MLELSDAKLNGDGELGSESKPGSSVLQILLKRLRRKNGGGGYVLGFYKMSNRKLLTIVIYSTLSRKTC
jgi:hypothetical protein